MSELVFLGLDVGTSGVKAILVAPSGDVADATTSPDGATRIAFTPLVPTSRPRKTFSATSAHPEQDLHRQLIQTLVRVPASA